MKLLTANGLSPQFFSPLVSWANSLNWYRVGSNGKDNYVEALFAKPPPIVPGKIP